MAKGDCLLRLYRSEIERALIVFRLDLATTTHFMSLSDLFPAITIGTLGRFFLLERPPEPEIALSFVSRICSRNRITSSNDSRESILKTSTNKSPATIDLANINLGYSTETVSLVDTHL